MLAYPLAILIGKDALIRERAYAGRKLSSNEQLPKAKHNVSLVTHHC